MKRLLTAAMIAALLAYGLPLLTLGMGGDKDKQTEEEETGQAQEVQGIQSDPTPVSAQSYDEKTQVTVLTQGQVETMPLSQYLRGVVAAEMPASFPPEALKAQATAARTYTLYKLQAYEQGVEIPESHMGAQLCDDFNHCKAYVDLDQVQQSLWGEDAAQYRAAIESAVGDTDGMVVTYQGEPIAAVFHAASSGRTEDALDVWGASHPYLTSVESPGEQDCPKYQGQVSISPSQFAEKFLEAHPEADFSQPADTWFRDSHRSQSGGVIDVLVGGVRVSGGEVRSLLGLNSANFTLQASEEALVFSTLGYGHGVGLSQYGARALALEGKSFSEILKWYYQGTEIAIKG